MTKLTIIGAGSTVFTKNIVVDLLTIESFKSIEIALMDINKDRLEKSLEVLEIISKKMGVKPKFSIHTDRKDALKDAEFVQTTIQVGGYRPSTLIDFEIPKKFLQSSLPSFFSHKKSLFQNLNYIFFERAILKIFNRTF